MYNGEQQFFEEMAEAAYNDIRLNMLHTGQEQFTREYVYDIFVHPIDLSNEVNFWYLIQIQMSYLLNQYPQSL